MLHASKSFIAGAVLEDAFALLLHMSLLPDLTHVNFLPDALAVEFNLLQAAPALTAALLVLIPVGISSERVINASRYLRTCKI